MELLGTDGPLGTDELLGTAFPEVCILTFLASGVNAGGFFALFGSPGAGWGAFWGSQGAGWGTFWGSQGASRGEIHRKS